MNCGNIPMEPSQDNGMDLSALLEELKVKASCRPPRIQSRRVPRQEFEANRPLLNDDMNCGNIPMEPSQDNGMDLSALLEELKVKASCRPPRIQSRRVPRQEFEANRPLLNDDMNCGNIPMEPSQDNGMDLSALLEEDLDMRNSFPFRTICQLPESQMGSLSINETQGQPEHDAMEDEPQPLTSDSSQQQQEGAGGLRYFIQSYDERGCPIGTSQEMESNRNEVKASIAASTDHADMTEQKRQAACTPRLQSQSARSSFNTAFRNMMIYPSFADWSSCIETSLIVRRDAGSIENETDVCAPVMSVVDISDLCVMRFAPKGLDSGSEVTWIPNYRPNFTANLAHNRGSARFETLTQIVERMKSSTTDFNEFEGMDLQAFAEGSAVHDGYRGFSTAVIQKLKKLLPEIGDLKMKSTSTWRLLILTALLIFGGAFSPKYPAENLKQVLTSKDGLLSLWRVELKNILCDEAFQMLWKAAAHLEDDKEILYQLGSPLPWGNQKKDFLRDVLNVPDCIQLPLQIIEVYPAFQQRGYEDELRRLASFSRCPEQNWYPAILLAKNGFYFEPESSVVCHFCKSKSNTWQRNWDPKLKHKPDCPFVNIPMELRREHATTNRTEQRRQAADSPGQQSAQSNFGAAVAPLAIPKTILMPKHSNFTTVESRRQTYDNWPSCNAQMPSELAEAGFFYTGAGDKVRCFHCDGGLRNWLDSDMPWIEHAKWFPRCGFLQRVKGVEFVLEETRKQNPQNFTTALTPNHGDSTTPPTRGVGIVERPTGVVRRVVVGEVEARMDTEGVKRLLGMIDMRHKETLVKYVIFQRLRQTGDDFQSVQEMLEAVLAEEPNLEENGIAYYKNILQQELYDVKRVLEENDQMKETLTCKVCLVNELNTVFLPCDHLVACGECARNLDHCPVCRRAIAYSIWALLW